MDTKMDTTQCNESIEQIDLCLEEQQEKKIISEECVIAEEQNSNVNLENVACDRQREIEPSEEVQMTSINKMANSFWEIARDNTKSAIKCEVKGSIVSRSIDIKLHEISLKREVQEAEMQELINKDNIINEHLHLEQMNEAPLLAEMDKTKAIMSYLNEHIVRNVERYQQLEKKKKELNECVESMKAAHHKHEKDKQNELDDINSKIQERNSAKSKLYSDFENDVARLKQELQAAKSEFQEIQAKNLDAKRQIKEIESDCDTEKLTEVQNKREQLNREINVLHVQVENLEQQEIVEEQELKQKLGAVKQNLKDTENTFTEKSTSLNAKKVKVEEMRSANSVHLEHLNDLKQSLENYKAKYEEEERKFEEMKLNYDSKLQDVFKTIHDLENKLSATDSELAIVNKEKMELSTKLTELRNERDETSSDENKLKLQKQQLEHEYEENSLLLIKYDEQNKNFQTTKVSLQATHDEAMEKLNCEVDTELQGLQEKKQHLIAELEEVKKKSTAAIKDYQEEFDVLVQNSKKETTELQEKHDQDLNEVQLQVTAARDVLNAAKVNFARLQQQYNTTIRKRDALGKRQNVLLEKPTKRELPTTNKSVNLNPSLVGILKNTGKKTPEKRVRFDPAGPNWDTLSESSSENIFNMLKNKPADISEQQGSLNSLFDDVLRNSPPVREKSVPKK